MFSKRLRTFWKVDQKYLGSFETWCWRRKDFSWTDRVRNEEVLLRVKGETNGIHTIQRTKTDWIRYILRRNRLLKHVIGGKVDGRIEVLGRRGRGHKQLLDSLNEKRSTVN